MLVERFPLYSLLPAYVVVLAVACGPGSANDLPPGQMELEPATLSFPEGKDSATLQVKNTGGKPISFAIEIAAQNMGVTWLKAEPEGGVLEGGGSASVVVEVTGRDELSPGSYQGKLLVSADGKIPDEILVEMNVGQPILQASPDDELDFGTSVDSLNLTIKNAGQGRLTYAITLPGPWLVTEAAIEGELPEGASQLVQLAVVRNELTSYEPVQGDLAIVSNGLEDENSKSTRLITAKVQLDAACEEDAGCLLSGYYCNFESDDGQCTAMAGDGASCADGKECLSQSCAEGICCNEACDGQCVTCSAQGSIGTCTELEDGTACDDEDLCTLNDQCGVGACQPGLDAPDCSDDNLCTEDTCEPAMGCVSQAVEEGTPCELVDECVKTSVCDEAGECVVLEEIECVDQNPCTADSCDQYLGCQFSPLTHDPAGGKEHYCNDEDMCTTGDACLAGVCVPSSIADFCLSICGNSECEFGEDPQACPVDCGWCGDGVCGLKEQADCAMDCGSTCGNQQCEGGESAEGCPIDCGGCGDGFCLAGENAVACPNDCNSICGNQLCEPGENYLICEPDCLPPCGNGECEQGENNDNCPIDCYECGDGICGMAEAQDGECDDDCLKPCGDAECSGDEDPLTCPWDCGTCPDGTCGLNETPSTCPKDCMASCGNHQCEVGETWLGCPVDCQCESDCEEKECGDDGCGGSCGDCSEGDVCSEDTSKCEPSG